MSADLDSATLDAVRRAIPADVIEIAKTLDSAGHRTWVVGGSLRDQLRAAVTDAECHCHASADWDLATDAQPRTVQRLFKRVIPTGLKHGTVTVLMGKQAYEVTTLRGEVGYSDARRPDSVYFVDDIRKDLARRDFTINAIAYDPLHDRLDDPFDGIGDLRRRLVRAVGDPLERFREDGLRVLRAARFVATLEFELEPATASAIRPSLDSFKKVSPERVRDEWCKAMKSRQPSRAFATMRDHGLLQLTAPELLPEKAGAEAPFELALKAIDACSGTLNARFAALLHKLGCNSAAPAASPNAHPSIEVKRAAELSYALLTTLKFSNKDRDHVTSLVRHQTILITKELSDADLRRWLQQVTATLLPDLKTLMTAIASASARADLLQQVSQLFRRADELLAEHPPLTISDLRITGSDLSQVCNLAPGPIIGRVLAALLDRVVEEPEKNQRGVLLEEARAWLASHE